MLEVKESKGITDIKDALRTLTFQLNSNIFFATSWILMGQHNTLLGCLAFALGILYFSLFNISAFYIGRR